MMQARTGLFNIEFYLLCMYPLILVPYYGVVFNFNYPKIIPKPVQPHIKCIVPDFYGLDNLVIFYEKQRADLLARLAVLPDFELDIQQVYSDLADVNDIQ